MLCIVLVEFLEFVIVEKWINIGVFIDGFCKNLVFVYLFRELYSLNFLWVVKFCVWMMCLGMCLWLKCVIFLWKWKFFIRVGLCLFVFKENLFLESFNFWLVVSVWFWLFVLNCLSCFCLFFLFIGCFFVIYVFFFDF